MALETDFKRYRTVKIDSEEADKSLYYLSLRLSTMDRAAKNSPTIPNMHRLILLNAPVMSLGLLF